MESDPDPSPPKRNGNLKIPLPFEDALRVATKVPADKLPKPNGKPAKRASRPAK